MVDLLVAPVSHMIDTLSPVLEQLTDATGGRPGEGRRLVSGEAFNVVAAFVDSDGLHTDEELLALVAAFGGRLDTQLRYASPGDLRKARLVNGKRGWLDCPSLMFDVLVRNDRKTGASHAWTYYDCVMDLAHAVAAVDAVPSRSELEAIERFRGMLVRTMELAGVGRERGRTASGDGGAASAEAKPETEAALPPARPLEELLGELDALVGLEAVKTEVKLVANLIKVQQLRATRGLPVHEVSNHLVFTGNPGTGKTTVARLLAQIYRTLGVVEKGHLVETDRSGLVAGFVGQTAIQVRDVVNKALGGVLLVDEAYALARGDQRDFGQEAIDTLVKMMEDHRDDFAVIAAGYPTEMQQFVESNPGLRSRFTKTIHFPDYSDEQLVAIFEAFCKKSRYELTSEARDKVAAAFASYPRDKGFGNARLARNLFESAVTRQASRVVEIAEPSDEDLVTLLPADIA